MSYFSWCCTVPGIKEGTKALIIRSCLIKCEFSKKYTYYLISQLLLWQKKSQNLNDLKQCRFISCSLGKTGFSCIWISCSISYVFSQRNLGSKGSQSLGACYACGRRHNLKIVRKGMWCLLKPLLASLQWPFRYIP